MPRNLTLAFFLLAASGLAHADVFAIKVRGTTPPAVTSIAETIRHFIAPTGYRLDCKDDLLGDFQDLCTRPAPANASTNIVALRDLLPRLLPPSVALYEDAAAHRLVIGIASGSRFAAYPVASTPDPEIVIEDVTPAAAPVRAPAPAMFEPVSKVTHVEPARSLATAPIREVLVDSAPVAIEQFTLKLRPGEPLSVQIARQAPAGYQIVWRARTDLIVAASAELHAPTYEDAVVAALRALWRTKSPLRVSAYSNNVLVVESL